MNAANKKLFDRILTMFIVFVVPPAGVFVASLPPEFLGDKWKILIGLIVTYLISILEGFRYLIDGKLRGKRASDFSPEEEKKE